MVVESLDPKKLGDFVAVMWECRNTWNQFIFGKQDVNRVGLAISVASFVNRFRHLKLPIGMIIEDVGQF